MTAASCTCMQETGKLMGLWCEYQQTSGGLNTGESYSPLSGDSTYYCNFKLAAPCTCYCYLIPALSTEALIALEMACYVHLCWDPMPKSRTLVDVGDIVPGMLSSSYQLVPNTNLNSVSPTEAPNVLEMACTYTGTLHPKVGLSYMLVIIYLESWS